MSLRERHTELTRTAILDAATEALFTRSDPTDLTVQAIADAAGVSHRTVYRHFESRGDLIEAVGRHAEELLLQKAGSTSEFPETIAEYLETADRSLVFAATNAPEVRKMLIASLALGVWRTDRDEKYWRVFRAEFPHLEEREARADFAVLRHVLGVSGWFLMGERYSMDLETLSPAVKRAAQVLVAGIAERDQAASRGENDHEHDA